MNKKLLFAAAAIILVIGAGMSYVLFQKSTRTAPKEETSVKSEEAQPAPPSDVPSATKGKYVEYASDIVASTQGTRLLFFHAAWCPQCRELDESIKTSELADDVTIFKVDYDMHQSLRAQYGVTLQTTVVKIDEKGDKISSYVAYDAPTFQNVKQALLP